MSRWVLGNHKMWYRNPGIALAAESTGTREKNVIRTWKKKVLEAGYLARRTE